MTPLAWELFEDVYSRTGIHIRRSPFGLMTEQSVKRRTADMLFDVLNRGKFFEMTKVFPMVGMLAKKMFDAYEDYDRVDPRLAFLPAPITWIEIEQPGLEGVLDEETRPQLINEFFLLEPQMLTKSTYRFRAAVVLIGGNDSTHQADRYTIRYETPRLPGPRIWNITKANNPLPLVHSGFKPARSTVQFNVNGARREFDKPVASIHDFWSYAELALINSPRVIGQRGHYPHGRAEREALKKAKMVGKFPLRAWTEIVLEVTAHPDVRSADPSIEMHLTGERCLHYCRTYLRVRHGVLEYVEGHWRGNPAIGIKRSRYLVKPEEQHGGSSS